MNGAGRSDTAAGGGGHPGDRRRPQGPRRATTAALIAGACVIAAPVGIRPEVTSAGAAGRSAPGLGDLPVRVPSLPRASAGDLAIDSSQLAPVEAAMILPVPDEPTVSEIDGNPLAATSAAGTVPAVQDSLASPATTLELAVPPRSDGAAAAHLAAAPEFQRPVDIEQIAQSEIRSLAMAQLREPGLADGAPTLAARVDAMQITLPPPLRLGEVERAALLTESPSHLLVRVGDSALGSVALRTSGPNGFDVQLSGLLELLADRFDSSEFERLRDSAAADTFVSFAQLRAIGLNLRYDPVYDELLITS